MRAVLVAVCLLAACKKHTPPKDNSTPADREAAKAQLDLLKRALEAFPSSGTSLPTCTAADRTGVLGTGEATAILGGTAPEGQGYAQPNGTTAVYWGRLGGSSGVHDAVAYFKDMKSFALFHVDLASAPTAFGEQLSPGNVEGRVVVFDMDAKPKCMKKVSLSGPTSAYTRVAEGTSAEETEKALSNQAAAELQKELTTAVERFE